MSVTNSNATPMTIVRAAMVLGTSVTMRPFTKHQAWHAQRPVHLRWAHRGHSCSGSPEAALRARSHPTMLPAQAPSPPARSSPRPTSLRSLSWSHLPVPERYQAHTNWVLTAKSPVLRPPLHLHIYCLPHPTATRWVAHLKGKTTREPCVHSTPISSTLGTGEEKKPAFPAAHGPVPRLLMLL